MIADNSKERPIPQGGEEKPVGTQRMDYALHLESRELMYVKETLKKARFSRVLRALNLGLPTTEGHGCPVVWSAAEQSGTRRLSGKAAALKNRRGWTTGEGGGRVKKKLPKEIATTPKETQQWAVRRNNRASGPLLIG